MPYIKDDAKLYLKVNDTWPRVSGELNYQITELIKGYWEFHGPNYQCINDIIGALEGAKLEFYRRIAVPYEDEKIKLNGDVY